ncbi:MAG: ABC transporter permease [Synergistaceae bacterium]|jgi:peptide/nickel transport system permease protein|nr:ABC transporter permease [Synergistaceae bacterium]
MNKLRRGLGTAILILLVLLAVFGPDVLGLRDGEVAPPYSKPSWMDNTTASAKTLTVKSDASRGDVLYSENISWNYAPPKRVSFLGRLDFGKIEWMTPKRTFIISDKPGEIDLDIRDIPFKRAMGADPFDDMATVLFPVSGDYSFRIIGQGEVAMKMEGDRWGVLGTDHRGRDMATLFVRGIRISLAVGLAATFIAAALGMSLGLISGYAGGIVDSLIMRTVDVLMSIPTLPILMVLSGVWGKGLWNLIAVLSIFSWMGTARTVRAITLSLRDAPWVEGLRALGAKRNYIVFRHLLPETLPLLLANVVLGVPGAILAEAGISFLGLSDPRLPSWGRMLHEAHAYGAFTSGSWWAILPPGIGIAVICLVFMDIGRKLEERADPRLAAVAGVSTRGISMRSVSGADVTQEDVKEAPE